MRWREAERRRRRERTPGALGSCRGREPDRRRVETDRTRRRHCVAALLLQLMRMRVMRTGHRLVMTGQCQLVIGQQVRRGHVTAFAARSRRPAARPRVGTPALLRLLVMRRRIGFGFRFDRRVVVVVVDVVVVTDRRPSLNVPHCLPEAARDTHDVIYQSTHHVISRVYTVTICVKFHGT